MAVQEAPRGESVVDAHGNDRVPSESRLLYDERLIVPIVGGTPIEQTTSMDPYLDIIGQLQFTSRDAAEDF